MAAPGAALGVERQAAPATVIIPSRKPFREHGAEAQNTHHHGQADERVPHEHYLSTTMPAWQRGLFCAAAAESRDLTEGAVVLYRQASWFAESTSTGTIIRTTGCFRGAVSASLNLSRIFGNQTARWTNQRVFFVV